MTATPHNGKDEDFQLFLSLLDSDRFYGKFRDGVHKVDASDLMRRMVKEEMVKFDGTPLFPERKAYTVNYKLSEIEAALYEAVTEYVKTEMGKADELQGPAKDRSVSRSLPFSDVSPPVRKPSTNRSNAARNVLKAACEKRSSAIRGRKALAETLVDVPEDDDDLNAEEQENLEETLSRRCHRCPNHQRTWRRKSSFSKGWRNKPRPWWPRDRTANGTNSRRSCRTLPKCATPPVGNAS